MMNTYRQKYNFVQSRANLNLLIGFFFFFFFGVFLSFPVVIYFIYQVNAKDK